MTGKSVLVLAPHADDESLGVGGTIRRHVDKGDSVAVVVVTGSGPAPHPLFSPEAFETVQQEARQAATLLGVDELRFVNLQAVTFPQAPIWETNAAVERAMAEFAPEVLYVPFAFDLHEDHRAVFRAASVAWRPSGAVGRGVQRVLSYEVQSETHWNATPEPGFVPNVWHELTQEQLSAKLEALDCYGSQMSDFPHARSVEAIEHLARWRGSQQGLDAAEAFMLIKEVR